MGRVLEARSLCGHVVEALLLLSALRRHRQSGVGGLPVCRRDGAIVGLGAVLDALVGELLAQPLAVLLQLRVDALVE